MQNRFLGSSLQRLSSARASTLSYSMAAPPKADRNVMAKQLLIITGSHDRTCDYLASKYKDVRFFRLDLDRFSEYLVSATTKGFEIETEKSKINHASCGGIYYRKPLMEDLTGTFEQKYHRFAHSEVLSLVDGIVESFDGPCLSKPATLRRANNKILQLHLASRIGFTIPDAAITNAYARIPALHGDKAIVKPLSVGTVDYEGTREYVQTNIVDKNIDGSLLKFCPSYFQQYIEKDYELRVTVVGNRFHAVKIESKNKVDWRKANNEITYSSVDLPDEIVEKCRQLMGLLDMDFGCFDFMVKDSVTYFLEMNANGQWAWLDAITQFEISKSLINYLTNGKWNEHPQGA